MSRDRPLSSYEEDLIVWGYEKPLAKIGVPQNYSFLSSGYMEELCNYIRDLQIRAKQEETKK